MWKNLFPEQSKLYVGGLDCLNLNLASVNVFFKWLILSLCSSAFAKENGDGEENCEEYEENHNTDHQQCRICLEFLVCSGFRPLKLKTGNDPPG